MTIYYIYYNIYSSQFFALIDLHLNVASNHIFNNSFKAYKVENDLYICSLNS